MTSPSTPAQEPQGEPTCGICGVCESWHPRTGCDQWTPVAPEPLRAMSREELTSLLIQLQHRLAHPQKELRRAIEERDKALNALRDAIPYITPHAMKIKAQSALSKPAGLQEEKK
jgi:hypothetical protein